MTPSVTTLDDAARERVRFSLDDTLLVEASAGTGKTRELVNRIVQTLARGARVDRIVAVTFTHAAAGEMKLRVRQELERAREALQGSAEADRLSHALEHLEEAFIGTIHAFCAQLLRERPVEARVDPNFTGLQTIQAGRMFRAVFQEWFHERMNGGSPVLQRALTRLACLEDRNPLTPLDQLRVAAWRLVENRQYSAPWTMRELNRTEEIAGILRHLSGLRVLLSSCARRHDPLLTSMRPVFDILARLDGGSSDVDSAESLLLRLNREIRYPRWGYGEFAHGVSRKDAKAAVEATAQELREFCRRMNADFAVALRDELWPVIARYEEHKQRTGALDFTDLLLRTRDLLRNNAEVRNYFQTRIDHLLVDEYQDTDPLQTEILLLLTSDSEDADWRQATPAPGRLFVVGDPKQSIYRFRSADVELYGAVRRRLAENGAVAVTLSASKRPVQSLQDFVNAAFAESMTGQGTQAVYSPLAGGRETPEMRPSIVALPAPTPYGKGQRPKKDAIDACLPGAVAGFIEWLVGRSGWTVSDPSDASRQIPIRPGHICILFRRFVNNSKDVTREYARALDARNIPHVLVGSRFFHRREEVMTLRLALNAIEWPDDEFAMYALLRGPLLGISDATLLRWRKKFGRFHPWQELPGDLDQEFRPVAFALGLIADLHQTRNARAVADTLAEFLDRLRAHAGFAFRRGGDQVLANVYRLCDLARTYEVQEGSTFRSFVQFLNEEAEGAEAADAPVIEDRGEGVRIMTVHNAKGLEFPVVILADLTAQLSSTEADRYVDTSANLCAARLLRCAPWDLLEHEAEERQKDEQEGVRVAYVAATRARDLLVVTALGDGPYERGWLSPLDAALYPREAAKRRSLTAPGCPSFGDRTVLDRPPDFGADEISVRPGLHAPRTGFHHVVWWDPDVLEWKPKRERGLVYEDLLVATDEEAADQAKRYDTWMQQRRKDVSEGALPRWIVTQAAESAVAAGSNFAVEFQAVNRAARPMGGRRFGTLVHAILQDVDWRDPSGLPAVAAMHARTLGASAEEQEAAVIAVRAGLLSPLVTAAWESERMHREWPFLLSSGREVVEGAVDLAYLRNGVWTLVDFKTDANLQARKARYEHQMRQYVAAVQRITGQAARGYVLAI